MEPTSVFGRTSDVSDDSHKSRRAYSSNEKEISHGGAVASSLNVFRDGAVGFIDWLDALVASLISRMRSCQSMTRLSVF
jgi:hypothetical protein